MEIVKIIVDEIDDLFNKFDNSDISDELAIYIENRCSRVKRNEMIIEIYTNNELDEY